MPFTLAHPAAALPLKWINKRWFSTTGLVFGSMAPDYEYFLKQFPSPTLSELGWGVFLFDFPLAIVGALIFHLLIKGPLIRHMPAPYDRRWSGFTHIPFLSYLGRHWAVFLLSVLLGMGSHLLMDWLTHPFQGPFKGSFMTERFTLAGTRTMPLLVSDHGFSILGLFILIWLVLKLKQPAGRYVPVKRESKWLYWSIFLVICAGLIVLEWVQNGSFTTTAKAVATLVWALYVGIVVASITMRMWKRVKASS